MRISSICLSLLIALAFIACGDSDSHTSAVMCASDAAPGTVSVFAPHVGASEGIAFLNGELYVAGGNGVRKIGVDGTATLLADIPGTIGMAAWKGALYVASQSDGTSPFLICSPSNHG